MKRLLLLSIAGIAFAQDPAQMAPYQLFTFDGNSGQVTACSGCYIYSYLAGTNTPAQTFTDSSLATPNTNPVRTNGNGYAVNGSTVTGIWVGSTCLKFVAKDSSMATMWTTDNLCDRGAVLKSQLAAATGSSLIGYKYSSAATAETVQARLQQYVSVDDFGALGDGTTNATAGIQAAFNARPTSAISFASQVAGTPNYIVTSTVTMTVPVGSSFGGGFNSPGVVIDLAGATIVCQQTSGPCLHIISDNINGYQGVTLQNGTILYNGSSSNVIGILVQDFTRPTLDSVKVMGFNTSGSEGIQLKNVEEARMSALFLTNNTLGLHLTDLSTANRLDGASVLQANTTAILVDRGSYGFTVDGNVIQSNTGVHAVEVVNAIGDPDNITETRFLNNHFENNGDGTANARDVYISAAAGRAILTSAFSFNQWNSTNGAGTHIEFAGAGSIAYVSLGGNQCNGALITGTANFISASSDNCGITPYDVATNSGGARGTTYWGPGAANKYRLYAGVPTDNDGSFLIDDVGTGNHLMIFKPTFISTRILLPLDGSQTLGVNGIPWPHAYITTEDVVNIVVGGALSTAPTTMSVVGSCGGSEAGFHRFVTDVVASTFGAVAVGGGGNAVPIYCDGSAWRIG